MPKKIKKKRKKKDTVFVVVVSEGSEVISVRAFKTKKKAKTEIRLTKEEDTFSEDEHGVELYERPVH
jgi:hypothetical protein